MESSSRLRIRDEPGERAETRLLLVRHGETPWNAAGRWQGLGNPGLTQTGRAQARDLGKRLASERAADRVGDPVEWNRIITSDLLRARETAEILAEALGIAVAVDERLRELDVGTWSGRTRDEIEADDATALARFDSGDPDAPAGGAESRGQLARRVRVCIAELDERYGGEGLIVVAHLGVLRALAPGSEPANGDAVRVTAAAALSDVLGAAQDA